MNYFISTVNFSSDTRANISTILPLMKNCGIKNIEISSLHPYEEDLDVLLVDFAKKYNLNILLHNFAPPYPEDLLLNLCSRNDFVRSKVIRFIKNSIDLTKKLGMDYYSFHAGFRVDYKRASHTYATRMSDKEAMDLFIEELEEVLSYAEKKKIHIGVENHVAISENKDNLILYGMKNWKRIFDEIPSDFLHLHLDIGHLKISAQEYHFSRDKFIENFGEHIMGMHIHDNTGVKVDSHSPFINELWLNEEHFNHMPNLKYSILETKTYGNLDLIDQMIQLLKEKVENEYSMVYSRC